MQQKQANTCNNKCLKQPMHPFPRLSLCHGNVASDSPNLPPGSSSPRQPWASSGEGAAWQANLATWSVAETAYIVSVERSCQTNMWRKENSILPVKKKNGHKVSSLFHKDPWRSKLSPLERHKHKCMRKHNPLSHSLISLHTQTHDSLSTSHTHSV